MIRCYIYIVSVDEGSTISVKISISSSTDQYTITCPGASTSGWTDLIPDKLPADPADFTQPFPLAFSIAITSAKTNMRIVIYEEQATG